MPPLDRRVHVHQKAAERKAAPGHFNKWTLSEYVEAHSPSLCLPAASSRDKKGTGNVIRDGESSTVLSQ